MTILALQVCLSMLIVHSVVVAMWPSKYRWPYEKWAANAWGVHVALWLLYWVIA